MGDVSGQDEDSTIAAPTRRTLAAALDQQAQRQEVEDGAADVVRRNVEQVGQLGAGEPVGACRAKGRFDSGAACGRGVVSRSKRSGAGVAAGLASKRKFKLRVTLRGCLMCWVWYDDLNPWEKDDCEIDWAWCDCESLRPFFFGRPDFPGS